MQELRRVGAGPVKCEHDNLEPYAEPWGDKHVNLPTAEVKRRWPVRRCPDCGGFIYATYGHMLASDS